MSFRAGLSDTRNQRKFFPPPSLHISLLRNDPWNEFVVHGLASNEDFLNFKSVNDAREAELRAKVYEQLTVVAGVGPELAPPPSAVSDLASVLPPVPVVELPSLPGLPSFLFSQPEPDVVLSADPSGEPASKAVEESVQEPVRLGEENTTTSIWGRVQSAWANLRGVSDIGLPSWFSAEQGLVPPTDPAIRAALGSIYGGTRSTVLVTVRVIEAIDVPALDWTGSSDPYISACIVRGVGGLSAGRLELLPTIGAIKSCTPKFSTLNPKWNESILLDPADLLSVISDSVLHISMWDKDILKADDPVGYTSMSLVDALQVSGVSPFPILPVQITGSLIGPHAGIFVKIQLRMIKKVGCVSVTPIALQGFTRGWKGYSVRLDVKVTEADPIASQIYVSSGLCQSESTSTAEINETGHALWPKSVSPVTVLFTASKKAKPYLHITLKTDSVTGDAGQVAVRIGLLEKLGGISTIKLSPLDGSPSEDKLNKCALYCGVECELGAD
jgi:hypothetical protein